jgi:hypothetical protein
MASSSDHSAAKTLLDSQGPHGRIITMAHRANPDQRVELLRGAVLMLALSSNSEHLTLSQGESVSWFTFRARP